jgi:hypothetical protein
MENQIKTNPLAPKYIQILKVLFNVKSTNNIKNINKKSSGNRIKKNELDYFEYTYINN